MLLDNRLYSAGPTSRSLQTNIRVLSSLKLSSHSISYSSSQNESYCTSFRSKSHTPSRSIQRTKSTLPLSYIVRDVTIRETDEEAFQHLAGFTFDYSERATFTADFDTALLPPVQLQEPVALKECEANRLPLDVAMSALRTLIYSETRSPRLENVNRQRTRITKPAPKSEDSHLRRSGCCACGKERIRVAGSGA